MNASRPTVQILLLAAGSSSRLGRPKQLLSYKGVPLLRFVTSLAASSKADRVSVILGYELESMREAIKDLRVDIVENPEWEEGICSSIRAGLTATPPTVDAVLFLLCDQPLVTTELLNSVIDTYGRSGKPVVACEYAGTLGVPALFDRSLFPELHTLTGDRGAKRVINRHRERAAAVPFPEGIVEIDRPEDLSLLDS